MTALRESVIRELEKLPEDKVGYILQIMQEKLFLLVQKVK